MNFEDQFQFEEDEGLKFFVEESEELIEEGEEGEGDVIDPPDEPILEDPSEEDDAIDPDTLKAYFEQLKSVGLITTKDDFEFDGTFEKLDDAIEHTRQQNLNLVKEELQSKLPDDFKALIDYALAGGRSLEDYIQAYSGNNLENLDLSTLENQRLVLTEYYKQTTKYSDDKILRMVDKLETLGGIEEEAEDALAELLELKETRKAELIANAAKEAENRKAAIEQETIAITNAIDSSITDKPRAEGMKSFLFSPLKTEEGTTTKFKDTIRKISNNPEHLAQLVDILYDYDPKKGIKLTTLEKQTKDQGIRALKASVKETIAARQITSAGKVKKQTSSSQFPWEVFNNN